MRRALLLVVVIAACGGKARPEPPWPKHQAPETWEEDGGESIEPRQTSDVAAVEASDEPTPAETAVEPAPVEEAPVAEPLPDEPSGTVIIDGEVIITDGSEVGGSEEPPPDPPPPPP